ncbi:hypothetical protein ACRRTK_006819 [Alexandromys fortis]
METHGNKRQTDTSTGKLWGPAWETTPDSIVATGFRLPEKAVSWTVRLDLEEEERHCRPLQQGDGLRTPRPACGNKQKPGCH